MQNEGTISTRSIELKRILTRMLVLGPLSESINGNVIRWVWIWLRRYDEPTNKRIRCLRTLSDILREERSTTNAGTGGVASGWIGVVDRKRQRSMLMK